MPPPLDQHEGRHEDAAMAMLPPISVDDDLRTCCPDFAWAAIACVVEGMPDTSSIRAALAAAVAEAAREPLDAVARHPVIAATRRLYRACGKEPNRYRPSAEQLRRRAIRGLGPSPVHPLVDIVNRASLVTGFSMGAFDLDAVGGPLRWGIGRAGEPYDAIGRGPCNIEGLPVLRDDRVAFGSLTADSSRTRVRSETRRFLAVLSCSGMEERMRAAMDMCVGDLLRWAGASDVERNASWLVSTSGNAGPDRPLGPVG